MNFQNIPRSNTLIKKAIIPKMDCLVCADYEQVEYRMLAYYMAAAFDDYEMANNFIAGVDPHAATAEIMLGRLCESDEDRQYGKTGNFSVIYAGGVPTIQRQMAKAGVEVSKKEAKALLAKLHEGMPGVKVLMEMLSETTLQKGYIFDIVGRHHHPDPSIPLHDALRKLLNALIQGGAAGLIREAVIKVEDGCRELDLTSHIINVVHDELVLDAIEDELPILAEYLPIWMGNETVESVVPITVGMDVSFTNWADKTPYERIT